MIISYAKVEKKQKLKLKHCPYCGTFAVLGDHKVSCADDNCGYEVTGPSDVWCIEHWNRRANV